MNHPTRGFTMWELTIVLAVIAVLVGVTLPAFTSLGMAKVAHPEDPVLDLLRSARHLAIMRGSAVSLVLDPATQRYRIDTAGVTGDMVTLVDTTLVLAPGTTLAADSARVHYLFQATGAAMADTLLVRANGVSLMVAVDPWEGVAHAEPR